MQRLEHNKIRERRRRAVQIWIAKVFPEKMEC